MKESNIMSAYEWHGLPSTIVTDTKKGVSFTRSIEKKDSSGDLKRFWHIPISNFKFSVTIDDSNTKFGCLSFGIIHAKSYGKLSGTSYIKDEEYICHYSSCSMKNMTGTLYKDRHRSENSFCLQFFIEAVRGKKMRMFSDDRQLDLTSTPFFDFDEKFIFVAEFRNRYNACTIKRIFWRLDMKYEPYFSWKTMASVKLLVLEVKRLRRKLIIKSKLKKVNEAHRGPPSLFAPLRQSVQGLFLWLDVVLLHSTKILFLNIDSTLLSYGHR